MSYYYPDLDDLLVDVYRRLIQLSIERGSMAVTGRDDPWSQLVAALHADLPSGPDDVDAVITYQFSGEPRFNRIYSSMSAALHLSQMSYFRSVIETGIAVGRFTTSLEPAVIARALIALADSYGLHVILEESGIDRQKAADEIVSVAASLLNVQRVAE